MELTFKELTTRNGLFCQFDAKNGILLIDVKSPISKGDFESISDIIDPYFEEHGELKGIIINSKKFPYWKGARNRAEYMEFASNNHHKFKRAAFVMGGFFTKFVVKIAAGRVHPELRIFKYQQIPKAQLWLLKS
jgi:hypothetical protein